MRELIKITILCFFGFSSMEAISADNANDFSEKGRTSVSDVFNR